MNQQRWLDRETQQQWFERVMRRFDRLEEQAKLRSPKETKFDSMPSCSEPGGHAIRDLSDERFYMGFCTRCGAWSWKTRHWKFVGQQPDMSAIYLAKMDWQWDKARDEVLAEIRSMFDFFPFPKKF